MNAMDRKENTPQEPENDLAAATGEDRPPEGRKPYDRKTRVWAWVGVAFMVFLTIMYFYVFYSGKIMLW